MSYEFTAPVKTLEFNTTEYAFHDEPVYSIRKNTEPLRKYVLDHLKEITDLDTCKDVSVHTADIINSGCYLTVLRKIRVKY